MGAVAEPLIDDSPGTLEAQWLPWLAAREWPVLAAGDAVGPQRRAVIVAPHPDDEVLCAGGMMAQWAALHRRVSVVALTDGDASHPGSTLWSPRDLARQRTIESHVALHRLGVPAERFRLGLPDGELASHIDDVVELLSGVCRSDDVLISTWAGDGHPDHQAAGEACTRIARRIGCALFEVPVWMWHWARPGDERVPWQRARLVRLDAHTVRRKRNALHAFQSQLHADPSTGRAAVLPASTVARASRGFEVVFA